MRNIDWKAKLTSRKLWVAIAGFISGLILAFGGDEGVAETVSGVILQGASVLGYLFAEGLVDSSNATVKIEDVGDIADDEDIFDDE